jgi:hypothetical protein
MGSALAPSALHGLASLARRYDGSGTPSGDGVVALARVEGRLGGGAGDLLIGRDLAEQHRQHGRVAHVAAGDLDRPDLQRLLVDPETDLAPDAALCSAVLARVPLPSTLIPALSIKRCNGPCEARCGMFTARVFRRRLCVLKPGISQSGPTKQSRLSNNPIVCRSALPNSTLIVRQVWTAASL